MTTRALRIVSLTAENIKRLKAVHVVPQGNTVVIAGRNAQGKTSVLDSIWLALGGGPAAKTTPEPIRHGEDSASVTLDLGELVVTRTWTKGGSSKLTVASADGARYSSPQAMLDGLIGKLSFDPLAFAQQSEKEQRDTLLSLVQLPFDLEDLDEQRRQVFEERTGTNRAVKEAEAQLAGMPKPPAGLPEQELSATEVLAAARAAQETWQNIIAARAEVDSARQRVTDLAAELQVAIDRSTQAKAALAALPDDLPDLEQLDAQLTDLEQTNAAVRAAKARAEVQARADRLKATAQQQTDRIAALDQQRADALAQATMPIDGLGLADGAVTYQGAPFKQASAAEQLRVSIAMAMALNPTIRVIRVSDASLLDSTNLALIEQMAAEHDFQVWLEVVDETGQIGVVIEDGSVRAEPSLQAVTA